MEFMIMIKTKIKTKKILRLNCLKILLKEIDKKLYHLFQK